MRGEAAYADGIAASFRLFARKYGLDRAMPDLNVTLFRPPRGAGRATASVLRSPQSAGENVADRGTEGTGEQVSV